jgi:hypothetical protein
MTRQFKLIFNIMNNQEEKLLYQRLEINEKMLNGMMKNIEEIQQHVS